MKQENVEALPIETGPWWEYGLYEDQAENKTPSEFRYSPQSIER